MYGAIGMFSCILYNLHVAPSVTTSGRSIISATGTLIEAFLSNNTPFGSLDEIITFIDNVCNNEERKYTDKDILDKDISLDEAFFQVMHSCGFEYIPTKKDCSIIWDIMRNLSQENLNRIYYKNNLYEFMNNKSMTNALIYILKSLKSPYLTPGKPNKEIKVEMEEFCSLLMEYVYYPHQIIDRMDKYRTMIRKSCILTDTDSVIASFDGWYRFCLQKVDGIDMDVKHDRVDLLRYIKKDEFGDPVKLEDLISYEEDITDYDFYSDEEIEMERSISQTEVCPQEGLKHSIINIMAYCVNNIINDYIERYTMNSNSYEPGRKCLLYVKNEFEMKRILLTGAMKNYASIISLQEGNVVPDMLDIKGLPLTKSTANLRTQEKLKEILYEEILAKSNIDQVSVLKELAKFEKEIFNSLSSGKKDFYSPVAIKSINNYDHPMQKFGIKQALLWNEIKADQPAIDLEERNTLDVVKLDINKNNIYKLKNINEDAYNKILNLMHEKEFEKGINGLAVPSDGIIPPYLIDFIDYKTIINDNLSLFPLESIGIERFNKSNNYTNIIHI